MDGITRPFDVMDSAYTARMAEMLMATKFAHQSPDYLQTDRFQSDLTEETHRRYIRFADHLVPWIDAAFPLRGATVLEVGAGTGNSALALSPHVERVVAFDVNEIQLRLARTRLDHFRVRNVELRQEYFGSDCAYFRSGSQQPDVALFIAVLEHMPFSEQEAAVTAAWQILRPGGVLVIAETPNRLSPYDYHTSWIPWFQHIPTEIQQRICQQSPRVPFAHDMKRTPAHVLDARITSWGRSVSYHEFELFLGADVHDLIIADGHEPVLAPIAPRLAADDIVEFAFSRMPEMKRINRAFTRHYLYFIVRKPTP